LIVLDTNVVSELMRPLPNELVVAWVDGQSARESYISAITLAELLYGVGRLPSGFRKNELARQIEAMVNEDFAGRVLAFDQAAAAHYADIVVLRERIGRPVSAADAQIAAITRSHGAKLATRNVTDFADVSLDLVNPWLPGR
jgi:toxin FitB